MEELTSKVPDKILERLRKARINSFEDFLTRPKIENCSATKIEEKDIDLLTKLISETVLKKSFTKVSELPDPVFLKTGCTNIDEIINGISTQGITEIYGESGCGKTQIGLQLSLQVQKKIEEGGLNGGCIYMCTEDVFPSKRLHQLKLQLPKLPLDKNRSSDYEDNIFIEHIEDVDQLKHCLGVRIPILLAKQKIKLIIIDSIAGAFRFDNETKNYIGRSEDLAYIANKLNTLSEDHKLVTLCINQITSDPIEGDKPCLGLAWTNLVTNRYEITRTGRSIVLGNQNIVIRRLRVVFSPYLPVRSTYFIVTNKGVVNLE